MGKDVMTGAFSREDRARYRQKVRRCLDVFALMLNDFSFDADRPMTGLELELNLIDPDGEPAMRNAEVLADLADPSFQTELGQFNLEVNLAPRLIEGKGLDDYERELLACLQHADERARKSDAQLVLIGILPTLRQEHAVLGNLSANPRYLLLNEQIIAARGEDMTLNIRGNERLQTSMDSIAAEAANTSLQFHLQVSPEAFATYWNASQAIAGVQVAVGANSPFLFGKRLWAETRIALFEQATDTRPEELRTQGVRPRVWFGERWITSIFDLFEENVRYFPPLLPVTDDEDPNEALQRGDVPGLGELRLHNGTIYRWNRPIYDISRGLPHLRVENRVLPAGPTVVDILANAAFYYGLLKTLAEEDRPLWTRMSFTAAQDNFNAGAKDGINAQLYWPGLGDVPVTELVLRRLLPLARAGLDAWDVDPSVTDRLLGIIEGRCIAATNGAEWQARTFHAIDEADRPLDRRDALRSMLTRY